MAELRSYEITVDEIAVQVLEAGPARSTEAVVLLGADQSQAMELVSKLGRFTRVVLVDDGRALAALDIDKVHVVVDLSETSDLNAVVELLQRAVAID